jgi:hypothetical protein
MRKHLIAAVLALGTLAGGGLVTTATAGASASAPYCGITWGSLPKYNPTLVPSPITNLRTGQHPCFDRLVVDLRGPAGGYNVRYVDQVLEDGTGDPIPLAGGAFLQVTINAPGYDQLGHPTYSPADPAHAAPTAGFRTFRQVYWAGSFEGYSTIGLGVRARLPMRVFVLSGPPRIVIDVAHLWQA